MSTPVCICSSSCFPLLFILAHLSRPSLVPLSLPSFHLLAHLFSVMLFPCVLLISPLCLSSPSVSHSLSPDTFSSFFFSSTSLLYVFSSPHLSCFLVFPLLPFFSHPLYCFIVIQISFLLPVVFFHFSLLPGFLSFSVHLISYFLPPSSFPCPLASSIFSFYFLPSFHLSSTFSIYFLIH